MPPKKKAAKKEPKAPKAPVGRPRKKLGTRVSDLPIVSTLRPRAARSNQDSMALQRARLQFKRDYPQETKGIDEYKSRALLDAMADPKRGAIGSRVLGPAQYQLDELADALLKAKKQKKKLVAVDGKTFVQKDSTPIVITGAQKTKQKGRKPAPPVPEGPPPVSVLTAKFEAAKKRADAVRDQIRQAEADGDDILAKELKVKESRIRALARTALQKGTNEREQWEASQGTSVAGPSGVTEAEKEEVPTLTNAQTTQVLGLVNDVSLNGVTPEGMRAIQSAEPEVKKAVVKVLENLMIEEQEEIQVTPPTVALRETIDEMGRLADEQAAIERGRKLAREEARMREPARDHPPPRLTVQSKTEAARVREIERREQEAADQEEEVRRENPSIIPPPPPQRQISAKQNPPPRPRPAPGIPQPTTDSIREQAARLKKTRTKEVKEVRPFPVNEDPLAQALSAQSSLLKSAIVKEAVRDEYNARLKKRRAQLNEEEARRAEAEQAVREMQEEEDAAAAASQQKYDTRREAAAKLQDAIRNMRTRQLYEETRDTNRTEDEAAKTLQAAMRSKLTRDAMQKAIDLQEKQDAAVRVIQRAVRDKVEGVAKQKRLVSKIQAMNELIPAPVPPRPPSAPGFTQPTISYEDIIDENDLTGEFRTEDEAARTIQAALRRFGDRSRFATARELEAEYAAQDAAESGDIIVPGADIRPNTRTIPVPPPMPPRRFPPAPLLEDVVGPIDESEDGPLGTRNTPRSGFMRQGLSEKGLAEAAKRLRPFEGQQSRISDFSGEGLVGGGFVGGVIRRLRGMGFFDRDGLDNILYPMPKALDNKQLLADAKAAYAAKGGAMGGTFDGRTDFRVLMDAMKTVPRIKGGAMGGGRVFLSGVSAPTGMTGGYPIGVGADSDEYKLHYVAFPDDKWTTSSSLRWLRSNGIVPRKKAMHIPEYYKYQILPPSDNKDYMGHELVSRGRKILLGYARPSK